MGGGYKPTEKAGRKKKVKEGIKKMERMTKTKNKKVKKKQTNGERRK